MSAAVVESGDVATLLGARALSAHKVSAGRVTVVAGSPGKIGASLLVARGALRAGAGLVTIASSPETASALDQRVLEAMTAQWDPSRLDETLGDLLEGADVVVVGPGIGLDPEARLVVDRVVLGFDGVKVVDADALTHIAGRLDALARAPGKLVLTPHPGEMGRLLGISARDVEADRWASIRRAVDRSGATVLLKGPRTIVGAPDRLLVVNASGSPALATGGSGDVLSGVVGALAAHIEPFEAAYAAAHVHGLSAERWSRAHGSDRGLLAHEIADGIPDAIGALR
jgi:NAD(P)H-hydrate epimerase